MPKIANDQAAPEAERSAREARRGWRFRLLQVIAGLSFAGLAVLYLGFVLPFWGVPFNQSRHGRVPLTPPWALECWLWEDDANTGAAARELLDGYARHDLPVRALLIDSPWSERYNDFKVDETRYPQPEQFFRGLQDDGYRVVLWMTCMVNSRNKDTSVKESRSFHEEARAAGCLAGEGLQLGWWKGTGSFIDYTNPEGLKWWRGLQREVLDWGIDGWKLDGTDTFFSSEWLGIRVPFERVRSGWMTTRRYMDHYARDEYAHGLSRNPEFVTLIRSLDGPWSHPEGFAPLDAAPVTWVGDNRHTWSEKDRGLEAALRDILGSARLGYCVIGSDVAGYHGHSNPEDISPFTMAAVANWEGGGLTAAPTNRAAQGGYGGTGDIAPNIYIRWAQFSTFCGLFLNGGHGNRRLWERSPAELEIIRKFAWLHTELVPYMYSHVVRCHEGGEPLMRPLKEGKFHYLFGDDLLVAPIHEDKFERAVSLPPGRWRYLFDDSKVLEGPQVLTREFPLDHYPVFVREGAIIPLRVSRPYTGFGDRESASHLTWLIYPAARAEFTVFHPDSHPKRATTTVRVKNGERLVIALSGRPTAHILRILTEQKPVRVTLDGVDLAEGERWRFDAGERRLIIRSPDESGRVYEVAWR